MKRLSREEIKWCCRLQVPEEFQERYLDILCKHQDALSIDKYDLGLAKDFKHKIHLKMQAPIYWMQFKIPVKANPSSVTGRRLCQCHQFLPQHPKSGTQWDKDTLRVGRPWWGQQKRKNETHPSVEREKQWNFGVISCNECLSTAKGPEQGNLNLK